jgi:hypothetical protein
MELMQGVGEALGELMHAEAFLETAMIRRYPVPGLPHTRRKGEVEHQLKCPYTA